MRPILRHFQTLRYFWIALLTAILCIVGIPAIASITPSPLDQQAQQLYESERYSESIATLQQSLDTYRSKSDWLGTAIVLSNLSLAYQHLSQWDAAEQTITEAIALLVDNPQHDGAVLAQALDIQGQLQRSQGQLQLAVESWEQAIALYDSGGASERAALSRIYQAQVLQSLGFYPDAIDRLTHLSKTLDDATPTLATVHAWQQLGDAQRGVGRLCEAEQSFHKSLQLAQTLKSAVSSSASVPSVPDPDLASAIASAYLGLGNVARSAIDIQSFSFGPPPPSRTMALLANLKDALALAPATASVTSSTQRLLPLHCKDAASDGLEGRTLDLPEHWGNAPAQQALHSNARTTQLGHDAVGEATTAPHWLDHVEEAIAWYQVAATVPDAAITPKINAQLNILSLLSRTREQLQDLATTFAIRWQSGYRQPLPDRVSYDELNVAITSVNRQIAATAQIIQTQVQPQIIALPPGRSAIEAQVNLAQSLIQLHEAADEASGTVKQDWTPMARSLAAAFQQALTLGDRRSVSFVQGTLGHLYALNNQPRQAQSITQQAIDAALASRSLDSLYQWQRQMGQLLKQQGQRREAIAAYTAAFETLQALRSDLAAVNADVRFSFRKSVEPVYRELVDLLLDPSDITAEQEPIGNISQADLQQARQVMEALQVAELENFFQSACLQPTLQLDEVIQDRQQKAAVIYPIILGDRLEVILKLPNDNRLIHYAPQRISRIKAQAFLQSYRRDLQGAFTYQQVKQEGQTLYNWLIQPGKAQLDEQGVDTLIFVLDGALRMVPMGALYDGQHYLAENYAIDVVLGLDIPDPKPLAHNGIRILAAGLVNPPEGFQDRYAILPNVTEELNKIEAADLSATILREGRFTQATFNRVLNQNAYDVIHLATHGQFSANRDDTFLLDANGKIPLDDLAKLFGATTIQASSVELLILSACRTATGSDRDVLGIAGTTVRAGAQSAIASLWSIDDGSSVVFTETFYQEIGKSNVSRAQALKKAQQAVMSDPRFDHPRYWAPYILVGNWL